MRIMRTGEAHTSGRLLDCKIYVRKNLTVVKASEWYYVYVGEYSYLPICELLYPEDADILRTAAEEFTGDVELLTGITNRREGYRSVYLRLEESDQTENGNPLYLITMFDILDLESRAARMEQLLCKYRHFMGLNNQYYFEYTPLDEQLVIYKYINEKSQRVYADSLKQFRKEFLEKALGEKQRERLTDFCSYLEHKVSVFELEFDQESSNGRKSCYVKGGTPYKDKSIVAGILVPDKSDFQEAYYLSPAGRDAGSGLLNKKAITEYVLEQLRKNDGQTRWFVMLDVDDFKGINDTYGHLFGDEVIRRVADVLREGIGYRGNAGRFGGDEFFVMLEKVPDREALKTLLKTVVKQLLYSFDPKCRLTISVGVSQYPKDGRDYEELLGKADKALYIAKDKGKNRHIIYDETLHGTYDRDNMRLNTGSYTMPREKRMEALVTLIGGFYEKGADYIQDKQVQKDIRKLFDLDGITVYSGWGRSVICRNGDYCCQAPEAWPGFEDPDYVRMFEPGGILVQSNMVKMKVLNYKAWEAASRQEIGASVQCLAKKEGRPYALINFDVFNRNRKWSDSDLEMLGIIGGCIGKMLCGNAEASDRI